MRVLGAIVLVLAAGCTTIKVAERNGCWVRTTSRLGSTREEIGPCARPAPKWADDRLTRILQECMASADHRWQTRAVEAWNAGKPLPARASEENVLEQCMSESARAVVGENEALKQQLAEAARDRDALRARTDDDRQHLQQSHDRLAKALGDAANKPTQPAVATATATSDGRAGTESALTADASPGTAAETRRVSIASPPVPAAPAPHASDAPASGPASADPAAAAPSCPVAPDARAPVKRVRRAARRPAATPGCPPPDAAATTAAGR